jgi:hypothetical protein
MSEGIFLCISDKKVSDMGDSNLNPKLLDAENCLSRSMTVALTNGFLFMSGYSVKRLFGTESGLE